MKTIGGTTGQQEEKEQAKRQAIGRREDEENRRNNRPAGRGGTGETTGREERIRRKAKKKEFKRTNQPMVERWRKAEMEEAGWVFIQFTTLAPRVGRVRFYRRRLPFCCILVWIAD